MAPSKASTDSKARHEARGDEVVAARIAAKRTADRKATTTPATVEAKRAALTDAVKAIVSAAKVADRDARQVRYSHITDAQRDRIAAGEVVITRDMADTLVLDVANLEARAARIVGKGYGPTPNVEAAKLARSARAKGAGRPGIGEAGDPTCIAEHVAWYIGGGYEADGKKRPSASNGSRHYQRCVTGSDPAARVAFGRTPAGRGSWPEYQAAWGRAMADVGTATGDAFAVASGLTWQAKGHAHRAGMGYGLTEQGEGFGAKLGQWASMAAADESADGHDVAVAMLAARADADAARADRVAKAVEAKPTTKAPAKRAAKATKAPAKATTKRAATPAKRTTRKAAK